MPNSKTDEARTERYLKTALKLNPVVDGERVVALRSKFLRIQGPELAVTADSQTDTRELRQRMSLRLDEIRRTFWKSDIGVIRKKLGQLKLDRFPDLRLARERLLILAEHRHEFGQFAEKGIVDPGFFKSFREVLVARPGVAATGRDELIESIRSAVRLKKIRSMIRMVRKQMPEIYALETDWLESIARMRKRKMKKESGGWSGFDLDFDGFGWVLWFGAIALLRLLLQWGGSGD